MVVELTTLRFLRGTQETAFLAADARVQSDFFYQQPGLVRRTTARGAGDWLIVCFWESEAAASSAAEAARTDRAAMAFASLVEVTDVRRYVTLD